MKNFTFLGFTTDRMLTEEEVKKILFAILNEGVALGVSMDGLRYTSRTMSDAEIGQLVN